MNRNALRMIGPAVLACVASLAGCSDRAEVARSQVVQWAETLDARTTSDGVYVRHDAETVPESDPWGHPIRVGYSRGGMSETLTVRSDGPDGTPFTADDIIETRMKANLAGIGTGVRQRAGELAEDAGRGFFKGAVNGLKDGFRTDRDPPLMDPEHSPDPSAEAGPDEL